MASEQLEAIAANIDACSEYVQRYIDLLEPERQQSAAVMTVHHSLLGHKAWMQGVSTRLRLLAVD